MPLMHSKSKEAFSHNVSAEMHAGKPQAQAVAIAYSVKKNTANNPMHTSETPNTMPEHKLSDMDIERLKTDANYHCEMKDE